ncbi:MAG TPA: 30S ribosomal protein S6 [Candidatus Paceibacterota bacterium]|nr:30S ribosomal protein S6 [Candidatus Paceibacterota bacterium]
MAKLDAEMRADDLDIGNDPRVYELGFHLDPELPSEEVKKAYQAVRDAVAEAGQIVAEGEPEKIQLAYTISRQEVSGRRDFDSAFFSWIVYETTPEKHAAVLSAASENKHIVRFIDVVTTKEAARHAVEMREMALKAPTTESQEAEAAQGAELDAALENVGI